MHVCIMLFPSADDQVLLADSVEEVMGKYTVWKEGMEARGLKMNTGKTKLLILVWEKEVWKRRRRWPCAVWRKGVGSNSILCKSCKCWVHKTCSGIRGRLEVVPDFKCAFCAGKQVTPSRAERIVYGDISVMCR